MEDKPISQFPAANSVNASDVLAGVQEGVTKKFSFAVILSWLGTALENLFVPVTRKVNNKVLSVDVTLTMDDIANGTTYAKPTASQVAQIGTNQTNISTIEGKIPSAASTSNQLADKAFVTDSITQGTAIFRGSFATKAALLAVAWQTSDPNAQYYVSNNDYAVVLADETQNNECWRYIYVTGTGWTAQYRINESPMTQAQLDAINSGATAAIINSVSDKLDKTGDGKDVTATFSTASTRANISTGEKLSVMFGKIAKWYTDLGTAAFATISTVTPQMDGTGAAGSTGEVSDAGHVHPTDTSRAPVYGLGHNLLDNWYFVGGGSQQGGGKLPINQRGMTTYTGNGYHLDRWINYNNPTLTVAANGVTVSASNAAGYANLMRQSIADPAKYRGVTLTASAMIEDSTADVYLTINDGVAHASGRSVAGTNLLKVTWTVGDSASALSVNFHNWTAGANPSFRLIAIKLEIGTEQTLAHQEGGSWVLNEIPNYEEELIKCQTSTADSTDNYAGMMIGTEQQIAKPQTGNTANRAYITDDYFCWNGLLFRAITPISSGATLTVNTNCVQTTVMDEIVRLTM